MEEWKVLPQYPNYMVSNLGGIKSKVWGGWRIKKPKLIQKGKIKTTRYLGFNVSLKERLPAKRADHAPHLRSKTLKLHQVVAELFIGPRPEGMQVLHIDGNELNCRADNLKYGTLSENIREAVAQGRLMIIKNGSGKFRGSKKP